MHPQVNQAQENKAAKAVATGLPKPRVHGEPSPQFEDNRPETIAQRKLQEMADNSPQVRQLKSVQAMADVKHAPPVQLQRRDEELQMKKAVVQKKANNTGLPDNLKSGVEKLSGYAMDDVKVHYNSAKPAQLNALAYAQGTNIHIAPGQERHLPHEAWHVVQQKAGRVKPTKQLKSQIAINDNKGLETEADVMGVKALNYTGSTQAPLQQKTAISPTVQRVNAAGVTAFFQNLRAAQPHQLNLYTHVMADGIGDAGLIGHLHDKITAEMANYGIGNIETYLAVEKFISGDDMDLYEEEHPDDNITAFNVNNPYIDQEAQGYRDLVINLSRAAPNHIVWAVSSVANDPRKVPGRNASPINDANWEIQYPVPANEEQQGNKLKIKEMGVNAIAAFAKTGEINEGIGYGIPELHGGINADEQAVLDQAAAVTNINHAWLGSIKGVGGINPLPRIIIAAHREGGNNTLVYLPGGADLASPDDYTVNAPIIAQGGLTLRRIDIAGERVYVITGAFRNEFIHHCMGTITNGVILSGGEGLYTESLATQGDDVAPIMAPRYNYQIEEVARAIAENQGQLAITPVVRYNDGSVDPSPIFTNYGVIQVDGVAHTYNQGLHQLRAIYGVSIINVNAGPVDLEPNGQIQVGYSQQLSSLYFPLSLNTDKFSHVPGQYNFQIAKATYAAERTRLREDHNWFDIISNVGQEQAAHMHNAPAQQPPAANGQDRTCPCCYITTACTLIHGLPDDCEELTVLRQLRDEYILQQPEGERLVRLYYEYAPAIVLAISQREDYYEFYRRLYKIIRQCVDLTLNKEFEAAFAIYCYMVHHLKEMFLPDLEINSGKATKA